MKAGKITQTVYRRSVQKQLRIEENKGKNKILWTPSREEACCGIQEAAGEMVLSSNVSLYGNEKDLCMFAMAQTANALAVRGATVAGVELQILLPEFAYESRIKTMMAIAEERAGKWNLPIMKADVQIVPGIQTTIVHANGLGTVRKENLIRSSMARPNQDIVLLGHVGLEGSLRIKREKEEELKKRFIPVFLNKLETYQNELYAVPVIEKASCQGISAMHSVTEGGILGALWEMAEGAEIGLSVDMRKIAVRQETIEVCECFHLNPYQLTSTGCILIVTTGGEELVEQLCAENLPAAVIGYTTDRVERVLMNGGEKRYLDRPAQDELMKFFSNCMQKTDE